MSEINLDYAKNEDLVLRRNGYFVRTYTVLLGESAFSFTNRSIKVMLFRNKSNVDIDSPYISKNSDDDTSYVTIADNVVTVYFTGDLTDLRASKYFWVLAMIDENDKPHIWFVGDYKIIMGASDESVASSDLTVTISDTVGNVNVTISADFTYIPRPFEDITGTKNGVNTTFTLPRSYITGYEVVMLNGVILTGGGVDYTRTGATIEMEVAPESTDNFKSMGTELA